MRTTVSPFVEAQLELRMVPRPPGHRCPRSYEKKEAVGSGG